MYILRMSNHCEIIIRVIIYRDLKFTSLGDKNCAKLDLNWQEFDLLFINPSCKYTTIVLLGFLFSSIFIIFNGKYRQSYSIRKK